MDDSNAQQSGEDDLFQGDTKSKKSDKSKAGDGEESDEENQQLESNISKALSDSITKVVVILVLIMLFLLPVLDTYTYIEEQLIFKNSIDLMAKQYDDQISWLSYQNLVISLVIKVSQKVEMSQQPCPVSSVHTDKNNA